MPDGLIERIQSRFEADRQQLEAPVAPGAIPLSYESITDEWLTETLCGAVTGAAVIGHDLGPVDDGSWNRRRIELRYNDIGSAAGLPGSVFCKASQSLENRLVLGVSGGAQCEVTFYRDFRPLLDIEAPQGLYAAVDPESFLALIVMNDVAADGATFCDHHTVTTKANAESQMRLLGQLHGASYGSDRLRNAAAAFPTWPEFFGATLDFGMQEGSEAGFAAAEEVIPPALYRRASEIWPATLASVATHENAPQSVTHCDVHLKNWYITSAGEMGLFDWNCCSRGHGFRDVAYTVATALRPEDRRNWERDLFELYLEELRAAGGPPVSFDAGWLAYRQQLMTALTWWTVTLTPPQGLPDMQPRDITLEFIRRIATAMDDHETLDSFDL